MNFWEDKYRVEEDGSVYRLKGYGCKVEKKLKPYKTLYGYLIVGICINGKQKKMFIHRLLALTYLPNPDNLPEVDHIDRDKTNNHISNLRWVSKVENMQNLKRGKTGELNITIHKSGNYIITTIRNKLKYSKYLPKTSTLEDAKKQRQLMLSMF